MRAGELRHQLTIEQAQEARDAFGAAVVTWVAFATVPGKVEALAGQEQFLDHQTKPEGTDRATIRYLDGLTEKMRVVHDGVPYNILRISDPDGRKIQQVLLMQRGLADG